MDNKANLILVKIQNNTKNKFTTRIIGYVKPAKAIIDNLLGLI